MNIPKINPRLPFAVFGVILLLAGIYAINSSCGIIATGMTALIVAVDFNYQRHHP
jgi:hypothetical protein